MTEKVVWHVVKQYAGQVGIVKLAPHDSHLSDYPSFPASEFNRPLFS
jgi:hypothetical protein